MNIDLSSTRCASCEGKGIPEILRPYCSVVCRILGRSGLAWRSGPCHIEDIQSRVILNIGPDFDLTANAITELQRHAERLGEKALINSYAFGELEAAFSK